MQTMLQGFLLGMGLIVGVGIMLLILRALGINLPLP